MVLCWWCCHPFEGEEVHLPYKHDELRNKFLTTGIFCSWNCVKAFALGKYGINRGGIICQNITLYRKRLYGKTVKTSPAPDRYALKAFGGTMTIEEFRNVTADNFPTVSYPNESHLLHTVTMRNQETLYPQQPLKLSIDNAKSKLMQINSADTQVETLKLKRPKPLKRDQNNLEKSLGIIRTKK